MSDICHDTLLNNIGDAVSGIAVFAAMVRRRAADRDGGGQGVPVIAVRQPR
jgi:hypothetical protein